MSSASDRTVILYSELSSLQAIAEGGFGVVYKGFYAVWGSVAYKRLKTVIIRDEGRIRNELLREAQQERLQHPNVIRLLAVTFEPEHYGCVFEFAKYGGLDCFTREFKVGWPMKLCIASGVIRGMNYLHSLKPPLVHGDLKLQNVLVAHDFVAKICDFGLAKWKQVSTERTNSKSLRGTVTHIPPESWEKIGAERTTKYDVYSFGILLWELFSEKRPFGSAQTEHIRLSVMDCQRPELDDLIPLVDADQSVIRSLKSNIEESWAQKPAERPTFEELDQRFRGHLAKNEAAILTSREELKTTKQSSFASLPKSCSILTVNSQGQTTGSRVHRSSIERYVTVLWQR